MKNVDLVASYWTLVADVHPHSETEYSPFNLEDRIVTAAKAGFEEIGLKEAATRAFNTMIAQFCSGERG